MSGVPGLVTKASTSAPATADVTSEGLVSPPPQQQSVEFPEFIQACQAGDLGKVKDLIATGDASAQDKLADGSTPLHWAAINNRLSICRYLLESGAEVDVKGGELQATPLHWACRSGLVYIAHLLIQNGADPLRTDSQGYNALHLATHSSNVLLVIYLLHQGLPVDTTDQDGRTALHWAAYQGDALTVDCLLNWGANVHVADNQGFTALHWAIVKGSRIGIKRLIEDGSDIYAKNNDGKGPRVMAEDMRTVAAWEGALDEAGRYKNGTPRKRYLTKNQVDGIMFALPTFMMGLILKAFEYFEFYFAIPISIGIIFAVLKTCKHIVLPNAYNGHTMLAKSPFLSGIFGASCFWTIVQYLWVILPTTFSTSPILNVVFTIDFTIVIYAFFRAMLMDPGYVPKLSGITEQKAVIEDLIDRGEYDSRHFCIVTYIHKPLRSKYDKESKRVVAKFDHQCPWVNNVIGVRNHRMFMVYVITLFIGLLMLGYLYFGVFTSLYSDLDTLECSFAPGILCPAFTHDSFTTQLMIWDMLQLSWVFILVFVQLVQIARALTTVEAANLHRFGVLGAEDFSSLPPDHHAHASNTAAPGEAKAYATAARQARKWYTPLTKLLGIDQFISTVHDLSEPTDQRARRTVGSNPANYGWTRNCMDFWFPQGLGWNLLKVYSSGEGQLGGQVVDYYKLYDYPGKRRPRSVGSTSGYELVDQV